MEMLPTYADAGCCPVQPAAGPIRPRLDQEFVVGSVDTSAGALPRIASQWRLQDYLGTVKVRWGIGRAHYTVDPGLYALGTPDENASVLVSANYKLSFDMLRKALAGRDLWILVLDTSGVNVWCAAGKGTFGTDELVRRIETSGLRAVVSHRSLLLPQLAGPGVAAHAVKKRSGFNVRYGPIRAQDIPAYMDAGFKATPEMRRKTFALRERTVLIPVELTQALKPSLIILPALFLLGGIGGPAGFWANALEHGSHAVLAFLIALLGGAVMHPLLLPYVPGRAFSAKGFLIGAVLALLFITGKGPALQTWAGRLDVLAWLLVIPATAAYLAMNFTGCSTYTSLAGVKKEMRWALPLEIGAAGCGLLLWTASRLMA